MHLPKSLPLLFLAAAAPLHAALTWKTFDISSLLIEERRGGTYRDSTGKVGELEDLAAAAGANSVKIRLWVNPSDGVYNTAYGVELGKRAAQAGLKVVLNLHYSDTWADPGHQTTPAAWQGLSLSQLASQVTSYTTGVVNAFADAGVSVNMVTIGNEIRAGFLWPLGQYTDFKAMGTLLTAGVKGIRSSKTPSAKTMLHLDRGYDWSTQQWFYSSLQSAGTLDLSTIDVLGISYYPYWDATASTLANFQTCINNLASTYKKPIVVAETDWPVKCSNAANLIPSSLRSAFAFSAAGQTAWMQKLASILAAVPNGLGQGLMYWEPAWVDNASLGSGCEDATVFTATWNGNAPVATALSSFNMFKSI